MSDPVLDDLKSIDESSLLDDSSKSSGKKRFFVVFLASFLVLLMLSYVFLSGPVYSFLFGLVDSFKLSGSELDFGGGVVFFDNDSLLFLEDFYDSMGDERALCFTGSVVNGSYFVSGFFKPEVFSRSWRHVSHAPCEGSIIALHTHPFRRCSPSSADLVAFERSRLVNPDLLMLIMCGKNRFSVVY